MRMRCLIIVAFLLSIIKSHAQEKLAGSYGLDPVVQSFLEEIHTYKGPPLQELSLDFGREAMEYMQKDTTIIYDKVSFEKAVFKKKKNEVAVVIVKPKGAKRKLPALVYFHGGGWVFNSFETHKRLMADIAFKAKVAVVFVEYSRAPEATYPIANEEGYLVTSFIAKQGGKYGLNPDKIIVAGDSAGGNMATVVAMLVKERKELNLLGQVLLYPVTDTNLHTGSYERFSKGHYLSRATMEWFWKVYAPNKALHSLGKIAPLRASIEELKGLPATLLITAEYDVLRDEGEAYAKKMREARVPVISTRYGGTIHDFIVLNKLRNTEASRAALAQICDFLKNNFYKE